MEVYQVGKVIKEKFPILESYNMTLEASVTKMMWVLARHRISQNAEDYFIKPLITICCSYNSEISISFYISHPKGETYEPNHRIYNPGIPERTSVEQFLRRKGYSRQNFTEIKRMPQSILVNGIHYYMRQTLAAGDHLQVCICETESSEKIPPVKLPLNIVYEDEDIAQTDVMSHPS